MINSINSGVLQIFAKNRQAGKVKTRLASVIGHEEALKVYEQLLSKLQSNLKDQPLPLQIFYSEYIEASDFWEKDKVTTYIQQGADLGERMKNAMAFGNNQYDFVILIGSDCPEIHTSDIQTCVNLLENFDVVIGPCLDGGYYLLACKGYFPQLFEEISWSTATVFEDTIKKIQKAGLLFETLPVKRDLDEFSDYQYFKEKNIL
ncbi:MAG: TIGR04282 family arsenosugar biosynthesis glycosyltransferase [Saprospiraceae bacterium]|nr:TIGR04282 family arsenosugar biosynthesis glycosyltransferase [Saprospiraceae bacterium]